MSCRGKAMHALGDCDFYFKPADFFDLLELNRAWFQLLIEVGRPAATLLDTGST